MPNNQPPEFNLPPEPTTPFERALVKAIASRVLEQFGQDEKWFMGCDEIGADLLARSALRAAKRDLAESATQV